MALDVSMWIKNFRNLATVMGIIIDFADVMMLYIEQLEPVGGMHDHSTYGVLILIFVCISWALGTLYAKYRSSGEEKVNAFAGSAWQMLFACAMFLNCSFAFGDVHTDLSQVPVSAWLSLVYLIVFGSIFTYSAYKSPSCYRSGHPCVCKPFYCLILRQNIRKITYHTRSNHRIDYHPNQCGID